MVETQLIVLQKTPYRESDLLLSGLSPDYGKLGLVLYGGQKVSANNFPVADLFRELEIEFEESDKSELQTLKSATMQTDFSALINTPKHYIFAGKLALFLLSNTVYGNGLPFTYDTLRSVLNHLAMPPAEAENPWSMLQCSVIFKTTFLYENGLLPESVSEAQNALLESLVASGIDNSPLPECDEKYWATLHSWLNQLLDYHKLVRR